MDLSKMSSVKQRSTNVEWDPIYYSDEDRDSFALTTGIVSKAQVGLEALYNNIEFVDGNKIPGYFWSPW